MGCIPENKVRPDGVVRVRRVASLTLATQCEFSARACGNSKCSGFPLTDSWPQPEFYNELILQLTDTSVDKFHKVITKWFCELHKLQKIGIFTGSVYYSVDSKSMKVSGVWMSVFPPQNILLLANFPFKNFEGRRWIGPTSRKLAGMLTVWPKRIYITLHISK